jgi:hypothetical protein
MIDKAFLSYQLCIDGCELRTVLLHAFSLICCRLMTMTLQRRSSMPAG